MYTLHGCQQRRGGAESHLHPLPRATATEPPIFFALGGRRPAGPSGNPPPHSDVDRKADTRRFVEDDVADAVAESAGRLPVNCWLFDDFLNGRLLSEDLLDRFGPERVRILSPNLRGEVVDGLRTLGARHRPGVVVGGRGCYHAFVDHWQSLIGVQGGIRVLMADAHRSFRLGAQPLLRLLGERHLYFAPSSGPSDRSVAAHRTRLVLVTSLLHDQMHHPRGQAGAIQDIKDQLLAMSDDVASPYTYLIQRTFQYRTMLVCKGIVGEVPGSARTIDDFRVRTILEEMTRE